MALSGSVSTNKYTTSNHGTIGLILTWTATQSIVNNRTTISWNLKSNGTMSSGYNVQAGPVTVKIAGTTVLNTTTRFNMYGGGAYSKSGTITVPHNEDGTKSVSMSVRAAIYSSSVNCTGSKTFSLNNITRYAVLNSVTNFTDEVGVNGYPTIEYSNPAGTDLVDGLKVRIFWDGGNDYTDWHSLSDDGSDSPYTFDSATLTSSDIDRMLQFCTTSNTLSVSLDLCSTLGGVEYHHIKEAVMTIVNAEPTAGTVTYADIDPRTTMITGDDQVVVQSQSVLRLSTASSSPQKHSSIVSYILNFNGNDYDITGDQYLDIEKPNYSGTFTASVRTTDSRGNVSVGTASITITPWQPPSAECSAERVNGFETNTVLTVNATISPVLGINFVFIEETHTGDRGQTWIGPNPIYSGSTTISLDNRLDWYIQITVSDSFGGRSIYAVMVGKGIPNIAIGKNWSSIGINGYPEKDGQLYVGGEIKVKPNDTDAGVVLAHTYSTTEQIVGYWTDGTPVYERVVKFNSAVTVNANAWNSSVFTNPDDIYIIDTQAMVSSASGMTNWGFVATQSVNRVIGVYNSRNSSITIDTMIIKYTKT